MKQPSNFFLLLCFLIVTGTTAWGGEKYAVASGNWGVTTTWSLTRGGSSGAPAPTATDTVRIPSPFIVTVEASAKTCYNLIIENGGVLIATGANPTSSQSYVRVSGDTVRNDGIIGYDPATPTVMTPICFESYVATKTVTIVGSGITRISRIRNGNNVSNTTVVIDQDVTLTYLGGTGTGGMGWYANQGTGSRNTLKINAGRTLTLVDLCNLGTNSSTETDGPTTTIQVDGSLIFQGVNSTLSLRAMKDSVVTLIVNGTVEVGKTFKPTGTTGMPSTIIVNAGGNLKVGMTGGGQAYFNVPAQTVTGAGTFSLGAGSTMQIGAAAGLDPVNGPIRTAVRNFAPLSSYSFLGNGIAFSTGVDFPEKDTRFSLNDTAGTLTLTNSLQIDTMLTLTNGKLVPGTKTVTLGPSGNASGGSVNSFIDGKLSKNFGVAGNFLLPLGQGSDYFSGTMYVSSVPIPGTLTFQVIDKTVTSPAGTIYGSIKVLKRFLRTTANQFLSVISDSIAFPYVAADIPSGVDETALQLLQWNGTRWVNNTIIRIDTAANAMIVTGATGIGDWVMTGPGGFFSGSPSAINFGIVETGQTKKDTITVTNTGNVALVVDSIKSTGAEFSVSPNGATITAGAAAKFPVTFTPVSAGLKSARIVFFNAGITGRDSVSVSGGIVLVSNFSVTPKSINFGSIVKNTTKLDSVVVTNSGNGPLVIDSVRSTAAEFTVAPALLTIGAGSSGKIIISYKPTTIGAKTGKILFYHNAPSLKDTVSVSGDVILAPVIALNKKSIDFGTIAVGAQKKDSIIVTNNGTANLVISSITSSRNVFAVLPLTATIAPAASQTFVITATLDSAKDRTGKIIIAHNAAGGTDTVSVVVHSLTSVSDRRMLPNEFALEQNYPNPFNPATTIAYTITDRDWVSLKIVDLIGRDIATLVNNTMDPGHYEVRWDASRSGSGIYFCRLQSGTKVRTIKLLLMK